MQPILVWLFGVVSTIACLVAVTATRPVRSVQAFLLILLCTSVTVLLLNGTLLALEVFLVCLGSSLAIRLLVIKRGKLKLGPPGRARINITRMLAFFAAVWFSALICWALLSNPASGHSLLQVSSGVSFGVWMALILLGSAITTSWLVFFTPRQDDSGESE